MSKITTDHEEIRTWIEEGNGQPGHTLEPELLTVYFGEPESDVMPIEWDEFFEIFDRDHLAFMYEDRTEEDTSSIFEFLDRNTQTIIGEEPI